MSTERRISRGATVRENEILSRPTRPLQIDRRKNAAALLEKMQGISFQGRNLATAYQVWKRMLGDRTMIMMGMSGAMVPAGMRRVVVYLIRNRLIDCLVSMEGHKYAIQVITDAAHWGGLSGCTFEEAQSWGKIAPDASMATGHCDSTVAMPILVTALSENAGLIRKRKKPAFEMGRELKFKFPR